MLSLAEEGHTGLVDVWESKVALARSIGTWNKGGGSYINKYDPIYPSCQWTIFAIGNY
jgi:hypothetical protein